MKTEQDIAPLIELLKMAAEQWPSSEDGGVSQNELFRRDQALPKMWPEACRRLGWKHVNFPAGSSNAGNMKWVGVGETEVVGPDAVAGAFYAVLNCKASSQVVDLECPAPSRMRQSKSTEQT